MLNLVKKFIRQDDGLEMVEWAIVAALITTAGAATMVSIGSQVSTQFGLILTAVTAG
jgi:pilus assembly protein Flp/PilA